MLRLPVVAVLACLAVPPFASAQSPQLSLPSFENLRHQAVESVNVTLGPLILGLAGWLIDDHDADSARVKKVISGLKSVQVRSFRFDSDFVYSKADVDAIRAQLSGPGWSRLTQVHNRTSNEDVDVYIALDGSKMTGLAVVASRPREFTVVNVVGALNVDELAGVERHLGIGASAIEPVSQRAH